MACHLSTGFTVTWPAGLAIGLAMSWPGCWLDLTTLRQHSSAAHWWVGGTDKQRAAPQLCTSKICGICVFTTETHLAEITAEAIYKVVFATSYESAQACRAK
eukprot:1144871-Pelagomonas_calceolata.AAC.1